MIFLIAAQPPPSAQDFADLEQALIGSGAEEDALVKAESVKAALQWVKRFVLLKCFLFQPCSFCVAFINHLLRMTALLACGAMQNFPLRPPHPWQKLAAF
jgi:hypothetical protein